MDDDPFAEHLKVQRWITPKLHHQIVASWSVTPSNPRKLTGGEEASIWLADNDGELVVIRISPTWRSMESLNRIYSIVSELSDVLPYVPKPIPRIALSGREAPEWVLLFDDHPVSLHSWVPGTMAPVTTTAGLEAVATMLAETHRELDRLSIRTARPAPQSWEATALPIRQDEPAELHDPDLDQWLTELPTRYPMTALIHGDVYERNLLWQDGAIVGLVDWDDLSLGIREQEIAWTLWEFCQTADGTDLDRPATRIFLDAYRAAGGQVSREFAAASISFIRRRLRMEYRKAFQASHPDPPEDPYYHTQQEAFGRLRGHVLDVDEGSGNRG